MPHSRKPAQSSTPKPSASVASSRDGSASPERAIQSGSSQSGASHDGESPPDPAAQEPAAAATGRAESLPFVRIFTDGACRGNPGPGGWAYLMRHPATGKEKEGSGGNPQTTNNQMELMAVIEGLAALKRRTSVEVVTDSSYVAEGSSSWLPGWKKNGWRRKEKGGWKPVKNVELWQRLDELLSQHEVKFTWVRGHAGHPENERCDELAVAAALACSRPNPRPRDDD